MYLTPNTARLRNLLVEASSIRTGGEMEAGEEFCHKVLIRAVLTSHQLMNVFISKDVHRTLDVILIRGKIEILVAPIKDHIRLGLEVPGS